jgi:hypothetical protein
VSPLAAFASIHAPLEGWICCVAQGVCCKTVTNLGRLGAFGWYDDVPKKKGVWFLLKLHFRDQLVQ